MDNLGIHKVIKRYYDAKEEVESLQEQLINLERQGYKSLNITLVHRVLGDLAVKLGIEQEYKE